MKLKRFTARVSAVGSHSGREKILKSSAELGGLNGPSSLRKPRGVARPIWKMVFLFMCTAALSSQADSRNCRWWLQRLSEIAHYETKLIEMGATNDPFQETVLLDVFLKRHGDDAIEQLELLRRGIKGVQHRITLDSMGMEGLYE